MRGNYELMFIVYRLLLCRYEISFHYLISGISANEKIEMDSVISVLKKKYQKQRSTRQKELLENHTKHMQDVTMEDLKTFLRGEEVEKG